MIEAIKIKIIYVMPLKYKKLLFLFYFIYFSPVKNILGIQKDIFIHFVASGTVRRAAHVSFVLQKVLLIICKQKIPSCVHTSLSIFFSFLIFFFIIFFVSIRIRKNAIYFSLNVNKAYQIHCEIEKNYLRILLVSDMVANNLCH